MTDRLRIGVIGAGRWSRSAHLMGFTRSPLAEVVAICDLHQDLAESAAEEFGIADLTTEAAELMARDDIDVIDVVTRGDHQDLVFAALEAGKHCLVEKPVCHDYRDVWRAHELAEFQDIGHGEASSYLPTHHELPGHRDKYLEQLRSLKESLDIPVIASLNGTTLGGWVLL